MEQNDFAKECLKFSYAIISKILELAILIDDENYFNLILPAVYYLTVYKN